MYRLFATSFPLLDQSQKSESRSGHAFALAKVMRNLFVNPNANRFNRILHLFLPERLKPRLHRRGLSVWGEAQLSGMFNLTEHSDQNTLYAKRIEIHGVECCVMRTKIPLAPREPDVTVHIVLNDFGPLGSAYVETDEAEADEATIIENILSGQYSHPLRVIAFNTAEGWACDVTEDIARVVLSKARSEHRSIGIAAQEFLVRVLGVDAPTSE